MNLHQIDDPQVKKVSLRRATLAILERVRSNHLIADIGLYPGDVTQITPKSGELNVSNSTPFKKINMIKKWIEGEGLEIPLTRENFDQNAIQFARHIRHHYWSSVKDIDVYIDIITKNPYTIEQVYEIFKKM